MRGEDEARKSPCRNRSTAGASAPAKTPAARVFACKTLRRAPRARSLVKQLRGSWRRQDGGGRPATQMSANRRKRHVARRQGAAGTLASLRATTERGDRKRPAPPHRHVPNWPWPRGDVARHSLTRKPQQAKTAATVRAAQIARESQFVRARGRKKERAERPESPHPEPVGHAHRPRPSTAAAPWCPSGIDRAPACRGSVRTRADLRRRPRGRRFHARGQQREQTPPRTRNRRRSRG